MTADTDFLDRLDAAIGCQQCGGPLGDSPSGDFCGPDCQTRWFGQHIDPLPWAPDAARVYVGADHLAVPLDEPGAGRTADDVRNGPLAHALAAVTEAEPVFILASSYLLARRAAADHGLGPCHYVPLVRLMDMARLRGRRNIRYLLVSDGSWTRAFSELFDYLRHRVAVCGGGPLDPRRRW